jgi:hypothetical protein
MVTYTPNYNLAKPGINDPADQDLWGGYLNDDMDILDTVINAITLNSVDPIKTTNYVLTTDDNNKLLIFDTTSGDLNVTFPAASGFDNGFQVAVKKIGATGTLNFVGTIDGLTNPTITIENMVITATSNNTAWYYKSDFVPTADIPSGEIIIQKKIIQSTTTATLSSTSYVSTGISFALDAPLSNIANKVRITVYGYAGVGANLGNDLFFTIRTGATDLAPGSATALGAVLADTPNGPTESKGLSTYTMFAQRTPGALPAETYVIYARAGYTASNFYVGVSADGTETLPTTIIIEEVQV